MRRAVWGVVAVAALWACGGSAFTGGSDAGEDGTGSSSGSGGSGSSSGGSSGGSGSSSGASSSSSGGSSSSSGSGSSSGASSSSSGSGSSSGSSSGGPPLNHRPNDMLCLQTAPKGTCNFGGSSSGSPVTCNSDSQCADAGPEGRCVVSNGPTASCFCTYDSCADDSGCPKGQTCACHGSPYTDGEGNHCVPSNCRLDADCGPGGWCSPTSFTMSCGGIGGYYCHTPQDQCVNDSDCADAGIFDVCAFDTTLGHWRCMVQGVCADPKR